MALRRVGIPKKAYPRTSVGERMTRPAVVALIPESTRKRKGGDEGSADEVLDALPEPARGDLLRLREEVAARSPHGMLETEGLMPAYWRFDGNMYRQIPPQAWEARRPEVEVLIVSGLLGLVASRDAVPAYAHSMAEPCPPFGKLNRWWHGAGLAGILRAYIEAVRPTTVIDLLSHEYREAVAGFADGLRGTDVRTVDFPGLGRGSQPLRGERIADLLRIGRV